MSSFPIAEGRRSHRVMLKRRASLVINLDRNQKRFPCLVHRFLKRRFQAGGEFPPKAWPGGRTHPRPRAVHSVRCREVWVGKVGFKQAAEVGLEIV